MPGYGNKNYWDERYHATADEQFDWMCNFAQLEPIIAPLIEPFFGNDGKQPSILVVGCGNAPLSADLLYKGGYTNLVNIDYSEVVVTQQKRRFPDMDWRVMDALETTFEDATFDIVIDKSLIDTTLCYRNGNETTMRLYSEIHRVLKPGGRVITISLHTEDEVLPFMKDFLCTTCKISNERKDEIEDEDERGHCHTFAVIDKIEGLNEAEQHAIFCSHPLDIVNAIPDAGQPSPKEDEWDPRNGLFRSVQSVDQLMCALDAVLEDAMFMEELEN